MTDLAFLPADGAPLAVQSAEAPALPIEGHIVRAVRAAEAARNKAEQVLLCLEYAPRDTDQMLATLRGLQAEAEAAQVNFCAYDAVRRCAGQG